MSLAAAGCVALGAVLTIAREVGMEPGERSASGRLGSVALFGAIAAPAVVALVAVGRVPVLLVGAGAVLIPLAWLSLAGAALPLLVPAAIFIVAGTQPEPLHTIDVGAAAVVGALVLLAAVSLFAHQDPASWATATGGGGTSDVVTTAEALASLACSTAAIFVAWFRVRVR